jgi:transcriptional regulator with XRE-family HTH domain
MQLRKKVNDVGRRLRIAREARGKSASALSLEMDPSPGRAWASFIENGRIGSPSVDNLKSAAVVLNVSFDWLATGNGEMEPKTEVNEGAKGAA